MSKEKTASAVPWKKAPPKSAHHTTLSASQKMVAKRNARTAGRPYPNLVDNMAAAKKKTKAKK
jgi:hypothetical protein